jgi:hypothetical protein
MRDRKGLSLTKYRLQSRRHSRDAQARFCKRGLSNRGGHDAPAVQVLRILTGIPLRRHMQRKGLSGDCLPGDDERLFARWMTWLHDQTDKHVGVTLVEFPMVMEVEVPRAVTVHVVMTSDGDVMSARAREGHPQCDPHTAVYQQVISFEV